MRPSLPPPAGAGLPTLTRPRTTRRAAPPGYTTDVLLDALTFNEHSGKAGKIDLGDVELAVQAKVNWEFKESGERDVRPPPLARLLPGPDAAGQD